MSLCKSMQNDRRRCIRELVMHTELVTLSLKEVWGSRRLIKCPNFHSSYGTRLPETEDHWSVWLHHNTGSGPKESLWERLGWRRKTLYGNPQSGPLTLLWKNLQGAWKVPPTIRPGWSPAANLTFNLKSTSTVPNNYWLWLFSFPHLQWFFYIEFTCEQRKHVDPIPNKQTNKTKKQNKVPKSRKTGRQRFWLVS